MKDLTYKYKSVAKRKDNNKVLIQREFTNKRAAKADVNMMKDSQFFDPEKYTATVEPI